MIPFAIDSATPNIDTVPSFYSDSTRIHVLARQNYSWSGPAVTFTIIRPWWTRRPVSSSVTKDGAQPPTRIGVSETTYSQTPRLQDHLDRPVSDLDANGNVHAKTALSWYDVIFYTSWTPFTIPEQVFDPPNGNEYFLASRICTVLP
jgi:hypothetical protein